MGNYEEVIKNIEIVLSDPNIFDKLSETDKKSQYGLVYGMKAKAHWKLHQYDKWAVVFWHSIKYYNQIVIVY